VPENLNIRQNCFQNFKSRISFIGRPISAWYC
jgi:hypothetical protein